MAQVISPDELGKDKTSQTAPGQPSTGSGQAGSGGAPQPQAVSNPNQTKGSGFTNIQRVVQANAGNKLGQTVGNSIQSAGNTAQDNLKQAQQQFQQGTKENQAGSQGNQQFVQNQLGQYSQNQQAPVNAPGQQDISRFQTLLSGQYQGPTELQNAQQIQNQAQNVGQMGQALGSTGGRLGLLNQIVGNPQYTSGQQNLDNLLLGQSNSPQLQAAKRQALTLQGKVGNAVTGAQAQGQQASNQAQAFGTGLQNQLGENVTSQYENLQAAAQKAQSERNKSNEQVQQDLASGQITPEEAQQLGIQSGQMMFNIDPNKFINTNTTQASAQNIASAQDYARLQGLQQLAGQYGPQTAKDVFGKFQDKSQAGQFAANPAYTVDQPGYQQAVQGAQTKYNEVLGTAETKHNIAQRVMDLVDQRDKLMPLSAGWQQLQNQISQISPGSVSNGITQSTWARSNVEEARKNLANQKNWLAQNYGTGTFNVKPTQS